MLKVRYIQAMLHFRKVSMILPQKSNLNVTEFVVMKSIAKNSLDSEDNISANEIQNILPITKSAISQMMNALKRKGYIERQIDPGDRRRVIVTLTEAGVEVLEETKKSANYILEEIISRLGNDKAKEFIELIEQVSEITENINDEMIQKEKNRDQNLAQRDEEQNLSISSPIG